MPDAIAICTPVSDYLVNIDRIPAPNTAAKLFDQSWQCGGNAATAIACAGRQGVSAGVVGYVGDDDNGKAQHVDFLRHQVDVSHLKVRPGFKTPYTIALSDRETNSRSFLSSAEPRLPMEEDELDMEYILSAKYLLLDANNAATRKAARAMLDKGGEVMYDASTYSVLHEEMVPYTSIYITSEFYWEKRYGRADLFACCEDMRKRGPHTVIFTLGAEGCAGVGPDGPFRLPAFEVPRVVDTTGCGDTFHGAYIVGLSRDLCAQECARWASASSAFKCTALGGRAALPTAELVERFLQTGEMDLSYVPERTAYYRRIHCE